MEWLEVVIWHWNRVQNICDWVSSFDSTKRSTIVHGDDEHLLLPVQAEAMEKCGTTILLHICGPYNSSKRSHPHIYKWSSPNRQNHFCLLTYRKTCGRFDTGLDHYGVDPKYQEIESKSQKRWDCNSRLCVLAIRFLELRHTCLH